MPVIVLVVNRIGNIKLFMNFSYIFKNNSYLCIHIFSAQLPDMPLSAALAESHLAIHHFFNNNFEEARQLLEPRAHTSMYHAVGHSVFAFLEAMLTFEQVHIAAATEALKQCADVLYAMAVLNFPDPVLITKICSDVQTGLKADLQKELKKDFWDKTDKEKIKMIV